MKKILMMIVAIATMTTLANAFEDKNYLPAGSQYVCIITGEYANNKWNDYTDRQIASSAKMRLKKFSSTELKLGNNSFDYANTKHDSDGDGLDIYRNTEKGYRVDILIPERKGQAKEMFKFMMSIDKQGVHDKVWTCVDMSK
jgi:hypothetical protein